ncbi:MAG: hypothetical protein WA687_07045 [Solirubrobacterales bacterium]
MQLASRRYLPTLAVFFVLSGLGAGCGSSDGGSGYGSRNATEELPTATATTPAAPPGASARTCEGTVAGTGELRVTGIECVVGRGVAAAWANKPSCAPGNEASRVSCTVDEDYLCLGATTERGVAVSCARRGGSLAFIARTD